jgi:hypothetical protein
VRGRFELLGGLGVRSAADDRDPERRSSGMAGPPRISGDGVASVVPERRSALSWKHGGCRTGEGRNTAAVGVGWPGGEHP